MSPEPARLAACLLLLAAAPALAQPAPPQGLWLTATGNLQVEIAPCGPALCGVAAKVLANHSMRNSKDTVAEPPKVGMLIISDLKPAEPGTWKGHIFNRENGKTYDCLVEPQGADALKLRVYVGLPLFGKDQVWRRVP
jgi:uncharacterized protein (DUF2147 family)